MTETTATPTLEEFLANHPEKPVVAVQGLGFVGAVMSLVIANAHDGPYAVVGIDQDTARGREIVDRLNRGEFPIVANDPKILEFYEAARTQGNLLATVDSAAFAHADVIIVDINLDIQKQSDPQGAVSDYDVDMGPFTAAMRTIGENCRPDVLVLVETTVPPGTCQSVVAPTIKNALAERGLPDDEIRIGHSYERVMPGPSYVDSIVSFYRVYSGIDDASADATEKFLRTFIRTDEYPLTRLGHTNATEMAKVLENSYRATNIAFAVEWSRMAEEAGVDLYEIVSAIRLRPTHVNLMLPGIGVGGYCLTKDPLLASWSRSNLLDGTGTLGYSESAVSTNDQMPRFAFEFLSRRFGAPFAGVPVLLLGVSYRGDVGDTRFSPVEPFYRYLDGAGAKIDSHDPFVRHWPETDISPRSDLAESLQSNPEIVVISAGHSEYRDERTIESLLACDPLLVYDTIGLLSAEQIVALRAKHTVIVLGRGDL